MFIATTAEGSDVLVEGYWSTGTGGGISPPQSKEWTL